MPGLSLVGLLFLAARLDSFGLPKLAKKLVTIMAICAGGVLCAIAGSLVNVHLAVLFMITSFSLYLALWIWGAALMLRLRRSLRVDAYEWWLDVETLPRVEWTWYARLGDGRVELVDAGGGTRWFENYADAIFWLGRAGFCPQDQALARELIDQPPAPPLAPSPRAVARTRSLAQSS